MLVSRLLDYVATVEDEAATAKKPLNGKERERFLTGVQYYFNYITILWVFVLELLIYLKNIFDSFEKWDF